MPESNPESLKERGFSIGKEHGINSASWVFDGNTTRATYQFYLTGIEEGDPTVLDSLNPPSLSGEYASDYGEHDLATDLGIDEDADPQESGMDDAAIAYRDGASEAFWNEVERVCRLHLSDSEA